MQLVSQYDEATGTIILKVTSKFIVASNCTEMRATFHSSMEDQKNVIIDLSKLDFVDSSGLGVLLSCLRHANDASQRLALVGLADSVAALFELVRMHRLFKIYDTVDDALSAFAD